MGLQSQLQPCSTSPFPKSNNRGFIRACLNQLVPGAGRGAGAGWSSPGRLTYGWGGLATACRVTSTCVNVLDSGNFPCECSRR